MGELIATDSLEWQPVRPDLAQGVFGKSLLNDGVKVVLTRVVPGGRFSPHRDPYGHLFYVIAGEGLVRIGGSEQRLEAGLAVRIEPGEEHSYTNTGSADLMLLSLNLPPR